MFASHRKCRCDEGRSVPFAFALYTVSSRQRIGRAALGYGFGVGIPLVGALALLLTTGSAFSPTVLDPYALVALLLGLIVRNRQQRREAITELVNQRIENARAAERSRITAEMHDVVAHSLSVMIALADGASTGWQKHPERSAKTLENLSAVGRTALLDMQRILQLLRRALDITRQAARARLMAAPPLPDVPAPTRPAEEIATSVVSVPIRPGHSRAHDYPIQVFRLADGELIVIVQEVWENTLLTNASERIMAAVHADWGSHSRILEKWLPQSGVGTTGRDGKYAWSSGTGGHIPADLDDLAARGLDLR